ncbi:hypothetical protein [Brevibacillus centrosporus]|uniref:Uncharacterized protein n=1 Tax=Brevibacillus centrosporus TaxID=54910 RepID=A0A1I3RFL4_9BACL|nr:hypothetical protein [Brevibacillus centrosporus]MEC2130345.1 hypothetical protein [Brevibacillus centrosporus]MED4909196.1 hypothetical protein [Brevibacillus centrosporus]RNB71054.1 hypothetical protein EDM55_09775 [Brevibacillus centrosporus]SFJ45363.1 hypothetical protein SAMN05518846_103417 [Brevibacillus centrosporus]GED30376.1 hypothetical protein BCE02nite_15170 [Brevibacillus centrosporus]
MKVTETAPIRAQIDKNKRFLEKPQLFNHAAKINDRLYYNVQYWKWGKSEASGYLILSPDGDVVPREEAVPVLRLFMLHNVAAHELNKELAPAKDKPIWMYTEKRDCLQALQPHYEEQMEVAIRRDMKSLIDVCQYVIETRDQLQALYDKGVDSLNHVLRVGYVTSEDKKDLDDLFHEANYKLYVGLRSQAEIRESVDRLAAFLQKVEVPLPGELKSKRQKLLDLLDSYRDKKLRATNDDSIKGFEAVASGQPVPFSSKQQLVDAFEKKQEFHFQTKIVPIIRNT